MFDHRVHDCEEAAHHGDECHFPRLAGRSEPLIKAGQEGIVPRRDQGGHIQRLPDGGAPAPNLAAAAEVAAVAVEGATPTKAAIARRSSVPNSGNSASSVRAVVGPMPGTLRSASSWLARSHWPESRCECRRPRPSPVFRATECGCGGRGPPGPWSSRAGRAAAVRRSASQVTAVGGPRAARAAWSPHSAAAAPAAAPARRTAPADPRRCGRSWRYRPIAWANART